MQSMGGILTISMEKMEKLPQKRCCIKKSSEGVPQGSYVVSHEIAKCIKPLIDGEFVQN